MRRYDRERNDTEGGKGFRIIEAGGRYLEPLTPPPPPRAPEPYKVVPSSSSLGRAHRRSSFVIIAETRPATPTSTSPSPTLLLPTGRVSPFRGRGFKGPLPHAQSRPQSPENLQRNARKNTRYDRRASVSQQNSPKRSLIPQPTRRRSVSLPKNNNNSNNDTTDKRSSPKYGRRAGVSRKSGSNGNEASSRVNISRRHSLKAPDLSPIQGTPTKPIDQSGSRQGNSKVVSKVSPARTRNNLTVPKAMAAEKKRSTSQEKPASKNTVGSRRFVEEKRKNPEEEAKTKIPMRRGSIVGKSNTELPVSRFLGNNVSKPVTRAVKPKKDAEKEGADGSEGKNPAEDKETGSEEKAVEDTSGNGGSTNGNTSVDSKKRDNDLGLMDLLKQSSGATGTSSVVGTTTTTAVQPLKIEAATILLGKDGGKPENLKKETTGNTSSTNNNPSSSMATSQVSSSNKSLKTSGSNQTGNTSVGKKVDGKDKEAPGNVSNLQTGSSAAEKKSSKGNVEDSSTSIAGKKEHNSGQSSKEKVLAGVTGTSKKNLLSKNGGQEVNRADSRVSSAKPGSRGNNSNNGNNVNNNNNNNSNQKNIAKEQTGSSKIEPSVIVENVISGAMEVTERALGSSDDKTLDNRKSEEGIVRNNEKIADEDKKTISKNVAETKTADEGMKNSTTRNGGSSSDNNNKKKSRTNGSDNSLKSANGLSTVSVESIRSTDTGVSVNTVRGLSSAREKKGMHMMKRSEEIETLSGNVMHLERNGEPAVLDISESPEEQRKKTRLERFRNSLTRVRERLSKMRCLGCRRSQKGQPWFGQRGNQNRGVQGNESTAADVNENPKISRFKQMWSRLKNSCRCTRLRECKCCRRAARVAPAESTTTCCPPERRCGALCGRLFSCCKCNRSEAQHTRSIRAKHSLTSVAPPPLSEEQRAKIPEVLVEHNSVMRGAIPCLPVPIAWFCLIWNVLLPGSGTIWSGIFNLCVGQPRFSISASPRARFGALIVNLIVGVSQFFTVLFCLVGWGWSIWWGVTMIRLARKYKRFRASEAASSDIEARGGEQTGLPPGVPSQALRGAERAR